MRGVRPFTFLGTDFLAPDLAVMLIAPHEEVTVKIGLVLFALTLGTGIAAAEITEDEVHPFYFSVELPEGTLRTGCRDVGDFDRVTNAVILKSVPWTETVDGKSQLRTIKTWGFFEPNAEVAIDGSTPNWHGFAHEDDDREWLTVVQFTELYRGRISDLDDDLTDAKLAIVNGGKVSGGIVLPKVGGDVTKTLYVALRKEQKNSLHKNPLSPLLAVTSSDGVVKRVRMNKALNEEGRLLAQRLFIAYDKMVTTGLDSLANRKFLPIPPPKQTRPKFSPQ